ncbi:MAG TPA: polymer-forming cytoskeletal protein [Nitrospiraceae bacterium]|jgi:cytoskeletal protein CcmA (bactofilin family)|nr:polymer-forming cytoskeletal protein [Nitrospiraceae bacterium]HXT66660.1 polymer-forming cytoskeletal protein [Nitrospiraceae bacterium]HZC81807.1 polymer-forming cytoskeletal protein [Nitrospiraceae bacterium]
MKTNSFAGDDNITLLAKGVLLRGEIHVEGTVRIDGRLDGDIQTKGQVIIGEDGLVQGTITAGTVISSGRIKAKVTANERVQLMKTATLIGEVLTPILIIEEGAKLQGVTDMGVTAWTDDLPKLSGSVSELSAHRAKQVVMLDKESSGDTRR